MVARRLNIYLVDLDGGAGTDPKRGRPCVVVSPDEANTFIRTVMIAPLTRPGPAYPTRVSCVFQGRDGQVVLDQIRTVDASRLFERVGELEEDTGKAVLNALAQMFAR